MAQWRIDTQAWLNANKTIFEGFVLTDKDGNVINSFGASSNIPIANGDVEGYAAVNKFGLIDGTSSNPTTIWTGNSLYTWQTEANTVSANSFAGQTQTITVQGLDENYAEAEEDIVLTAATETAETSQKFIRVHRAFIKTGDTNTANVNINHHSSDDLISQISEGYGQTLQAFYTVPAGKTAYLSKFRVSSAKQQSAIVTLFVRPFGGAFRAQALISLYSGVGVTIFDTPLRITEKSDIEVRTSTSQNNVLSSDFDMILVDNP